MLSASNSTDEDGDYHREMDANKFEAYLMRVAPALKHGLERLVVLVLDNAPYHCRYADKKPTMATTGAAMKDWRRRHNIPFSVQAKKKNLYSYLITPLKKSDYNVYVVEKLA
uniref:Tc1-like transposase DDE domain-containing protein n=1 Tax=Plectus sambesii TaxID=2011161 RepID=A0A914W1U5_9BILA